MSFKSKNVISNFTGVPVTIDNQSQFQSLDDKLSGLQNVPYSILDPLTEQLQSSKQLTSIENLETLFSSLPLNEISIEIQNLYGLTGLADGLAIASGKYFVNNFVTNKIEKNDLKSYAFSFFDVLIVEKNKVTISINNNRFSLFISSYLPKLNELIFSIATVNAPSLVNLIKILFIYSLNKILNNNTNVNYSVYEHSLREKKSNNSNSYFYDTNVQYNFYLNNYERVFNENFSYTNIIPNYYAVNDYLVNNNQNVQNQLSLGNNVTLSKKTVSSQEYYDEFSRFVSNNANNEEFLNNYSSIFKNILLDSTSYQTNQISTENFPYVNEIKFFNNLNPISNYLIENKLELLTLNNCYSSMYELGTKTTLFNNQLTDVIETADTNGEFVSVNGTRYNNSYITKLETNTIQTANFNDVFNFLTTLPYGFEIKNNNAFKFDNNFNFLQGVQNLFRFAKLNNFFFEFYNVYNDYLYVNNLETLRSDSVCYFIEKQLTTTSQLQTIGLTAETGDEIKYQDTQISYNKDTIYNVFSVESVPNINLNYENIENYYIQLDVDVNTKIEQKFYKNLIFTTQVKVQDNAPAPPLVRLATYRNVNSIFTILFDSPAYGIRDFPISIQTEDLNKFIELQNKETIKDGKISFQSDDSIDRVQIFRTTVKPNSYSEFFNSLLEEVPFNGFSATSYLMEVEPNVKYYMTFRSIDVHGLFSNPTEVFEVESISNSGANYFVINTINLFNNKSFNFNKNLRKYLSITPSFDYSQFIVLDNNQIKIGTNDKLWGQKFKIRVKSLKSGKAFDVNIKYIKNEIDLT